MRIDLETAKGLEQARIVEFRGLSGEKTDAETAAQAPVLCRMHAMAGRVYKLEFDGQAFTCTEVKK